LIDFCIKKSLWPVCVAGAQQGDSLHSRPAGIYPYLLRGIEIARPNQVRAMDITYIPMARRFDLIRVLHGELKNKSFLL
jgi:hypothetical protein